MVVDICRRCNGIWYDRDEFIPLVKDLLKNKEIEPEPHSLFEPRRVNAPRWQVLPSRSCPKCDVAMRTLNYAYDSNVYIERCPECSGLWADRGETLKIARYMKEDPRITAYGHSVVEHNKTISNLGMAGTLGDQMQDHGYRLFIMPRIIIPYKDDAPCTIFPWLTIGIITLCTLVFIAQFFLVPDPKGLYSDYGFIPSNFFGIGLITSMFIHADVFHLLGNMLFLWLFGDNIEDRLGRLKFLLLYFLSDFSGALLHTLFYGQSDIPSIGASGAISGIMGAYAVLFPHAKVSTYFWGYFVDIPAYVYFGGWFGMQVLFACLIAHLGSGGIGWFSHIGGFVFGMLFAFVCLRKRPC